MGIWAAGFDGANGGGGDHGIAEPVAGADEDFEGLEGGRRGEEDAAFGGMEEELWAGSFPAIMDPEPIGGMGADLVFELGIEAEGEGIGGIGGEDGGGGEDDEAPAGDAGSEDGGGGESGARAEGESGGESGSGSEAIEEGGPEAGVAGVLIHEDAEGAAIANELAAFDEAGFAFEEFEAEASAIAADFGIDEGITEGLEDRADGAMEIERGRLGEHFPAAEVTDGHDEAAAGGIAIEDGLEAFDGDHGLDFFLGERGEFDTGEEIGAEGGEVFTGEGAQLFGGKFFGESDGEIMENEASVRGGEEIGEEAEGVTEAEDEVEGEEIEERGDRPVKGEGEAIHQRVFFQKMDLMGCSSRRLGSMPPSLEGS